MAEIITRGYLIDIKEYATFDHIITFINEYGNKFTCISLGSRKIASKNRNSIQLGNLNEFEFFLARDENKISKLKRSVLLEQSIWPNHNLPFYLLNDVVNKLEPNIKVFEFYKEFINILNNKQSVYDDDIIILLMLKEVTNLSGIAPVLSECVICKSKKISSISFEQKGLMCSNCSKEIVTEEMVIAKATHYLFNNNLDQLTKLEFNKKYLIAKLGKYISENAGIFIDVCKV